MKIAKLAIVFLAASCFAGCASVKSAFTDDEEKVPVASLPKAVTDTATATLKGFTPVKASMEKEDGLTVYELKGMDNGEKVQLEITAEGKLMKMKRCEKED